MGLVPALELSLPPEALVPPEGMLSLQPAHALAQSSGDCAVMKHC
jgi:hypothetical protein